MWKRLGHSLSPKEVVGVITVVLVGAGCLYASYRGVTAIVHRRGLERSIPSVLAGVREQREALIAVIETYKSHLGFYPPLLTPSGTNRGLVNPLCYELLGVRFNAQTAQFYLPTSKDGVSVEEAQKYFNMRSFSNCLPFPNWPTNFLANRTIPTTQLLKESDLFGVGLGYADFLPQEFWEDFDFSPWRYVTNPAEHNPGKFDLWIEVRVAGKHFTIGNWPEVK